LGTSIMAVEFNGELALETQDIRREHESKSPCII